MGKFAVKGNRAVARGELGEGFKSERVELCNTDGNGASGE